MYSAIQHGDLFLFNLFLRMRFLKEHKSASNCCKLTGPRNSDKKTVQFVIVSNARILAGCLVVCA